MQISIRGLCSLDRLPFKSSIQYLSIQLKSGISYNQVKNVVDQFGNLKKYRIDWNHTVCGPEFKVPHNPEKNNRALLLHNYTMHLFPKRVVVQISHLIVPYKSSQVFIYDPNVLPLLDCWLVISADWLHIVLENQIFSITVIFFILLFC